MAQPAFAPQASEAGPEGQRDFTEAGQPSDFVVALDRASGQLAQVSLQARALLGMADAGSAVAATALAQAGQRCGVVLGNLSDMAMREVMTLSGSQRDAAMDLAAAMRPQPMPAQAPGQPGSSGGPAPTPQDSAGEHQAQAAAQPQRAGGQADPGDTEGRPDAEFYDAGGDEEEPEQARAPGTPRSGAEGWLGGEAQAHGQAAAAAALPGGQAPATPGQIIFPQPQPGMQGVPSAAAQAADMARRVWVGDTPVLTQRPGQATAKLPPTAQAVFAAADIRLRPADAWTPFDNPKGKGGKKGEPPAMPATPWDSYKASGKGKGPAPYGKPGHTSYVAQLQAKARSKGHQVRAPRVHQPQWVSNSATPGYKLRVGDLPPDVSIATVGASGMQLPPMARSDTLEPRSTNSIAQTRRLHRAFSHTTPLSDSSSPQSLHRQPRPFRFLGFSVQASSCPSPSQLSSSDRSPLALALLCRH
jgi:hypothetical protein